MRVKLLKPRLVNGFPKVYPNGNVAAKGAVLEVSDATGAKWIAAGMAEAVKPDVVERVK